MSGVRFRIVGIFSSPEVAQEAVLILDSKLEAIAQWHRDHPEESRQIKDEWPGLEPIITPIEEAIKLEYGVEWDLPVLIMELYKLSTYKHFLFLKNTWSTRTGAYPLDRFIERLGGTALVEGEYINDVYGELKFTIHCAAPNEQIAKDIETAFNGSREYRLVRFDIEVYAGPEIREFEQRIPEIIENIKKVGCQNIVVESIQSRTYYIDWDK